MIALSIGASIAFSRPVHADDVAPLEQEVVVTAEDYAKLLGAYGQVGPLKTERDRAEAALANMTEQRDLLTERVKLKDAIIAEQRELLEIRAQRIAEERARGDVLATARRREGLLANVKEKAAIGALLGAVNPFPIPGLGNVGGAIIGAAAGAIYGAIESLVQGP